jgi:hypothetical protein
VRGKKPSISNWRYQQQSLRRVWLFFCMRFFRAKRRGTPARDRIIAVFVIPACGHLKALVALLSAMLAAAELHSFRIARPVRLNAEAFAERDISSYKSGAKRGRLAQW